MSFPQNGTKYDESQYRVGGGKETSSMRELTPTSVNMPLSVPNLHKPSSGLASDAWLVKKEDTKCYNVLVSSG